MTVTIGEKLRKLRNEKGVTQRQLAEAVNYSSSYIGDLESNRTNPSIKTLEILARYFDTEMGYFFEGECCYQKKLKGSSSFCYIEDKHCKDCLLLR